MGFFSKLLVTGIAGDSFRVCSSDCWIAPSMMRHIKNRQVIIAPKGSAAPKEGGRFMPVNAVTPAKMYSPIAAAPMIFVIFVIFLVLSFFHCCNLSPVGAYTLPILAIAKPILS